jgi:hypothetical protein
MPPCQAKEMAGNPRLHILPEDLLLIQLPPLNSQYPQRSIIVYPKDILGS